MAAILRRAGSKESADARCASRAAPDPSHADSENVVPAVPGQQKVSKQALTFVSTGGDRGAVSGAPASTRISSALSDITNMFYCSRGPQRKGSNAAGDFSEAFGELPVASPEALQGVVPESASRSQMQSCRPEEHNAVFEKDREDLFRCAEYAPDIIAAFFRAELAKMPDAKYMESQPEVNPKMRGILIDWLLEVHSKHKMQVETLYLAVNIIDRYMSLRQVKRRQLQLLGVVALFTAAKYEELDPPKAAALAYLTDNAYTRGDIIDFEFEVLNALGCEVVVVTPANFLDRLARANGCEPLQRSLVSYLLDLSLIETQMIRHPPSQLVSAAILLSNDLLGVRPRWSVAMAHHSRQSEAPLQPIAEELRELLERSSTSSLQAARRKYQSEKNHRVADLALCVPGI